MLTQKIKRIEARIAKLTLDFEYGSRRDRNGTIYANGTLCNILGQVEGLKTALGILKRGLKTRAKPKARRKATKRYSDAPYYEEIG